MYIIIVIIINMNIKKWIQLQPGHIWLIMNDSCFFHALLQSGRINDPCVAGSEGNSWFVD